MTGQCSVFMAISLDGFIARPDGSIDWLERANAVIPEGEDCGYSVFFETVDALVMGRGSFEKVLAFPEWPYGDKPVYVLSRSLPQLPAGTPATVHLSDAMPAELVHQAAGSGRHHLYVDGGKVVQSFLAAGLITELTLTIIPVLIGSGLRLFGEVGTDVRLELLSSRGFSFGFVQSRYRVIASP